MSLSQKIILWDKLNRGNSLHFFLKVKIFVSYSRQDAGDFAEQIQRHFASFKYDIFTDVNSINVGDIWSTTIEDNIAKCDVFVVIVTYGALQSSHVENEILQAQRQKKRIIPCLHRRVRQNVIKWGLDKIQGVEFNDKYELARDLYSNILQIQKNNGKWPVAAASGSYDNALSEAKNGATSTKDSELETDVADTSKTINNYPTERRRKVLRFNLKKMIPIISLIAVAISSVVIFGLADMKQFPFNTFIPTVEPNVSSHDKQVSTPSASQSLIVTKQVTDPNHLVDDLASCCESIIDVQVNGTVIHSAIYRNGDSENISMNVGDQYQVQEELAGSDPAVTVATTLEGDCSGIIISERSGVCRVTDTIIAVSPNETTGVTAQPQSASLNSKSSLNDFLM